MPVYVKEEFLSEGFYVISAYNNKEDFLDDVDVVPPIREQIHTNINMNKIIEQINRLPAFKSSMRFSVSNKKEYKYFLRHDRADASIKMKLFLQNQDLAGVDKESVLGEIELASYDEYEFFVYENWLKDDSLYFITPYRNKQEFISKWRLDNAEAYIPAYDGFDLSGSIEDILDRFNSLGEHLGYFDFYLTTVDEYREFKKENWQLDQVKYWTPERVKMRTKQIYDASPKGLRVK